MSLHPRWNKTLRIALLAMFFSTLESNLRAADSAPRVYRDHIEPHWFAKNTRFWYRNDLPSDRHEFILVDAEAGTRKPAFDARRAAQAISKASGLNFDPEHLSVDSIQFEDSYNVVTLLIKGKRWRIDLKTYDAKVATSIESVAQPLNVSSWHFHPTHRTGAATQIKFENRTTSAVNVYWLNGENTQQFYAEIAPAQSWQSSTFDGHVWLVSSKDDQLLAAFEAQAQASVAVIDTAIASPRMNRKALFESRKRNAYRRPISPDGKWKVIVNDNKLIVRNIDSGVETILGSEGNAADSYSIDRVWWSPDSRKLVAMRTEPAQEHKIFEIESSPKDQVQPKLKTLDYLKPGDKIAHPRPQLFDVTSMKRMPLKDDLFSNPWSLDDVNWAADSSRFTFMYNERGHQNLRLIAIDALSGAASAIIDERSATFICYSSKYFIHWIGEREIIWMSERDGWNHLYLIDAKTGAIKNQITRGEWVVQSVTHVDEAKRCIWFNAGGIRPGQDPYYSHACRSNFDGSGLSILTEGDGQHALDFSPDDRFCVDSYSRVDLPPISELRRADTGKLICTLEEADASEVLAARGGRWPERFSAKGRDGKTDIFGVIIYPRDFDPAKKYPVIEDIYAGPHGFFTPKAFQTRFGQEQKIADAGAIVVRCDGMGTSGRSKAFHDVCWRNLRDSGFPDRIAWIKAAAATRPQMDLSRVGIYGGSAGGQSAMAALLWHNDFYKVAVADCGCHDNRMDKIWWNEQWMGWPVGKEYEENSNVVNAHLLQGKLMLIVGELDSNVDPSSTMQVVGALEKANKDFELLIVVGANHGAAETPYGTHRRLEFLKQNLQMGQ